MGTSSSDFGPSEPNCQNCKMTDTHVSLAVIFNVPDGVEFRSKFPEFYKAVKGGTKECLFYGFAVNGNKVLCREGYKSAAGVAEHGKEVKALLEEVVAKIGADNMKILVCGPAAELEKLKPALAPRGARFIPLQPGALKLGYTPSAGQDTHITILPEFTVPDGKMGDAMAALPKFAAATKAGAGAANGLYYGFGIEGNSVFAREGYKDAAACAAHSADVKAMLDEPLQQLGQGGMKINVVGPKAEIDKLRPKLEPRGAVFWELDSGAIWM